jgi:predicted O-linked N-acetylglucosamine transferase (SPINDLY family)
MTTDQAMHTALKHHRAGRLADAEAIYRQVLAQRPDHAEALHLLGVLAGQVGRTDAAIDLIRRAIVVNPGSAEYHNNLGETYRRTGQSDRAIACFRRAIELRPDLGMAHNNLGSALQAVGRPEESIAAFRRLSQLQPASAEAHCNLGVALHKADRLDEAVGAFRRAIALDPGHAEAYSNLGSTLRLVGQFDAAIAALARALELKPDLFEAHKTLGVVLCETCRFDAAIAALGRAIELKGDDAGAHSNLGFALHAAGRIEAAIASLHRALELKPDLAESWSNLSLLFTLHHHPDYDAQAILAEHRRWARQFADPLAGSIRPHPNDRTPGRRLRIGFVSPDFRDHPVGQLLVPLFTHRDRRQFEVFGYSDVRVADATTGRLKGLADEWRNTVGLGDAELAERIRGDRIDILVDLALHTAGNRMRVFARKPAPVQVTMLGLPATTGLSTIDYRLTDPDLDPPGVSDADYSEQSIRLPHCFWIFQPPAESPPVGALPALRNGFVTFGNLNQFAKASRPALELWLKILQVLPESRLVLRSQPGGHRDGVRALFCAAGVSADRVEFTGSVPRLEYLQRYHELDVCLDPFPYNGHTSTLDALWMGVPVITLVGRTAVGRGGKSILTNMGHPELIAETPERYVAIAVELAGDRARLAALRAGLRRRMQSSPLVDGPGYAADVEAAFRKMWTTWCQKS